MVPTSNLIRVISHPENSMADYAWLAAIRTLWYLYGGPLIPYYLTHAHMKGYCMLTVEVMN